MLTLRPSALFGVIFETQLCQSIFFLPSSVTLICQTQREGTSEEWGLWMAQSGLVHGTSWEPPDTHCGSGKSSLQRPIQMLINQLLPSLDSSQTITAVICKGTLDNGLRSQFKGLLQMSVGHSTVMFNLVQMTSLGHRVKFWART